MKNIKRILLLAALSAAAVACTKVGIDPDNNSENRVKVSVNARMGNDTKTTIDFGNPDVMAGENVWWLDRDSISVFIAGQSSASSILTVKNLVSSNAEAAFEGTVPVVKGTRAIFALTPAIAMDSPANIEYTYPSHEIQTGMNADHVGSNMVMYARVDEFKIPASGSIDGANLQFNHLGSILRFHIINTAEEDYIVTGIEISERGTNKRLYDRMKIDLTQPTPTFTPVGTTMPRKTLHVNNAPNMMAGTGSYDCYMTIAPQAARTAANDKLIVKVLLRSLEEDDKQFSRTLTLDCTTTDLIKNGFAAGSRYQFSIELSDFDTESGIGVTVEPGGLSAELTKLTGNDVTELTVKGSINYLDFNTMRDNMPNLATLDLSEVTLVGDSIPSIAFFNKETLKSIQLPRSLKTIGSWAFDGCTSLTSIKIPDGVTSIGMAAFQRCSGLTSINIPEGVTSIGNHTFYGCSSLASILIPNSVTIIGDNAFSECINLVSVNIPNGMTSIGYWVFEKCSSLASINIPNSVISIGLGAFSGCSSLTSINIPDGVTSIGEGVFNYCSALTSITLPEGLTSIGMAAFQRCSGLTSINIPEGVNSIGDYAFNYCSALTSITLPEGLTSIGNRAFQVCSGLTSINIPIGVTFIGDYAFSRCENIAEIVVHWTEADKIPTYRVNMFDLKGNGSNSATIRVPENTQSLYKSVWTYLSNIFYLGDVNTGGSSDGMGNGGNGKF